MSNFRQTRRQQLEDELAIKLKQFKAVTDDLSTTLNAVDRPLLEAQRDKLAHRIEQLEADLAALGESPAPAPQSANQRPLLFMAEALPPDFVPRPQRFDPIIHSLVRTDQDTVAITAALKGAGGYGKTTLARAVCHEPRVQQKFRDGILWITLGEKISDNDLIARVFDLIEILTDKRPTVVTLEAAKSELKEAVGTRALLLVVDDVWEARHALPFLNLGPNIAVLITTRNSSTLPVSTRQHNVDAMETSEAVALLQGDLPTDDALSPAALTRLAARLGEWPLLLKLANGQLRKRINQNETFSQALAWVERALTRKGFGALNDPHNPVARNQAAAISLGVSLELLQHDQRAKFERLAIFPEDTDIPFATLEKLWQLDEFDVEDLGGRCAELSLLLRFDLREKVIRLHDVVRTYLCELPTANLAAHHAAFLAAYGVDEWHELPANEPYLWRWLAYHLREAGQLETLRALLLDFKFLQAKLNATDANALIADFVGLTDDEPLRLVESALGMSAHILAKDPTQLRGQLYSRLMSYRVNFPSIAQLLNACEVTTAPFLFPIYQTFQPAGGALLRTLEGHDDWVNSVAISGDTAFSASYDNAIKVWNWQAGTLIRTLEGHSGWVNSLAISGDTALSAAADTTIKVWNWQTGILIRTLEGHSNAVMSVAISGDTALSASSDTTIKVWNWQTGILIRTLEGHSNAVMSVAISGDTALSAAADTTIKVWNWQTGTLIRTLEGHSNTVNGVAISGDTALTASADTTIKVWNWQTGTLIRTLEGHSRRVNSVAISGDTAFSASSDKTVKVWNWQTGTLIRTLEGHSNWVNGVAISGDTALSGSYDTTIKVWNWQTGTLIRTLEGHSGGVRSVELSGDTALCASADTTIKVWNWQTGTLIRTLEGHNNGVNGVAVSGDTALSTSDDTTIKVWNWQTGALITTLSTDSHQYALAIVPDMSVVLSGGGGGQVHYLRPNAALLALLRGEET